MQLVPAIDIINGTCVRLHQGRYDEVTEYSSDIVATARRWHEQGAQWLHLVDLDGARLATAINFDAIAKVVRQIPELNIEVGGGIRDKATIERYLNIGVSRVIIGSQAVKQPDFFCGVVNEFPYQIVLGLDAKNGIVMTEGWLEGSQLAAVELIKTFTHLPLAAIIYTDISRDGTLTGVNLDSTKQLALQANNIPVFASGGVSGIRDIEALLSESKHITGVILGKSLYEGNLDLAEALSYIQTNKEKYQC